MRFFNKIYANMMQYFWLPCALCTRMFGGHEIAKTILMTGFTSGEAVCKKCELKATLINHKNRARWGIRND